MSSEQFLVVALFLTSFGSFAWGMRRFFIPPPVYTIGIKVTTASGFVFAALHFICLTIPSESGRPKLAICFYVGALILFWWAVRINRRQPLSAVFSSDLPAHLMKDGPYRFIRHPFYASYMLTWIAGPIGSGYPWLALTVAAMLILYIRAARFEERKFAASPLAAAYELYRARTGILVPNPLKLMLSRSASERLTNAPGLE